jgi:hypothetical protein
MAYTWRPTVGLVTDQGTFTTYQPAITGTGSNGISEAVAGSATTVLNIDTDVSAVIAFGIKCTVAASVGVNDAVGGSPDETITLAANKPLVWVAGDDQYPASNPLGAVDVTALHVTVADPTAGTLEYKVLYDATP